MWTYDLTDDLIVEFETIIALATMTYIVKTYLYELHPMAEWVLNDINNVKINVAC